MFIAVVDDKTLVRNLEDLTLDELNNLQKIIAEKIENALAQKKVIELELDKLFETQMAEMEKLNFSEEIIGLFRSKKDALLERACLIHKGNDDIIPFIPVISTDYVSFKDQFHKIAAPLANLGDICDTFDMFFHNEESAQDISESKSGVYFLLNVGLPNYGTPITDPRTIKEVTDDYGYKILNHAETLVLAHFKKDIFEQNEKILIPGIRSKYGECACIERGRDFHFRISFIDSINPENSDLDYEFCLAVCEERL
jgi:hypothetical protein